MMLLSGLSLVKLVLAVKSVWWKPALLARLYLAFKPVKPVGALSFVLARVSTAVS